VKKGNAYNILVSDLKGRMFGGISRRRLEDISVASWFRPWNSSVIEPRLCRQYLSL
jgi:hypothetical protein